MVSPCKAAGFWENSYSSIPFLTWHLPRWGPDFCFYDIHFTTTPCQCALKPAFFFLSSQHPQALIHLSNTVVAFLSLTSLVWPDPELKALAGLTDTMAYCSQPDIFGDAQTRLGRTHHSVRKKLSNITISHLASKHGLTQPKWSTQSYSAKRGKPVSLSPNTMFKSKVPMPFFFPCRRGKIYK